MIWDAIIWIACFILGYLFGNSLGQTQMYDALKEVFELNRALNDKLYQTAMSVLTERSKR